MITHTALTFSRKVINFFGDTISVRGARGACGRGARGTLSRGVRCNQKVIKSNQNTLNNKTPESPVKSSNSGISPSGEGGI